MILIGNILRNLTTAREFHYLKWLLIYGSKYGKYWFSHIVHSNFTTMVSTETKLWFLSFLEHFWSDPLDILSKGVLFLEKIHKTFQNNVQGCSAPLNVSINFKRNAHMCFIFITNTSVTEMLTVLVMIFACQKSKNKNKNKNKKQKNISHIQKQGKFRVNQTK